VQDQYTLSVGTKRLLERFEELWKMPHEISLEELKRIITNLPEVVQFMGIETIAGHFISIMKLHFLDIIATFNQKAEEENIEPKERDEILKDDMPELFQAFQKLEMQISVHSIHDLVMLANITFGLYLLSQVVNAEEALRWLYKLPRMYRERLEQEHLLAEPIQFTAKLFVKPTKSADSWNTAFSQSSAGQTWGYRQQELFQIQQGMGGKSSLVA
jgi:hypothetical protein